MQPVDDTLVPPAKNLIFEDEISGFVFAAEEESDDGGVDLLTFCLLLEIVDLLLDEGSERSETCACSNENDFLPSHRICEGGLPQFSLHLLRSCQDELGDESVVDQTGRDDDVALSLGM